MMIKRKNSAYSAQYRRPALRRAVAGLILAAFIAAGFRMPLPLYASHTTPEEDFTQVPDSNIWQSPSVSAGEAYNLTLAWLRLPDNVRNRLINDNVKIYLIAKSDEVLTSARLNYSSDSRIGFAGLTTHPVYQRYVYPSSGRLAYVKRIADGAIELQTDAGVRTYLDPHRLIHEVGHYMDSAAGAATGTYFAISSSADWQVFYEAYGSDLLRTSAYIVRPDLYSAQECFADAFRLLCTDPDALEAISPSLYNYVSAMISAIPEVSPAAPG